MESESIQPYTFEPIKPIVEESDSEENSAESDERESDNGQVRTGNVSWCKCKACRPMDTERESLCCQEMSELNQKLDEASAICITNVPSFDVVCKHPDVLRTALVCMHDVRSDVLPEPLKNRILRLAAYRQFTWWIHIRLGKAVRKVIPSCSVWSIRDAYPEEDNGYTGFRDPDDDEYFPV